MKKFVIVLLALTALHAAARVAFSQCGPAGCAPRQLAAVSYAQTPLRWWNHEGRPQEVYLYSGNTLVGYYSYADGFYRRAVGGRWSGPAAAPLTPPFGGLQGNATGHTFGAVHDQVSPFQSFSHNGNPVSREQAENVITGNLRDDSAAGHLTNIDADKERRKRFDTELAELRRANPTANNVRVQNYDPNAGPNKVILAPFKLDLDQQFRQSGRALFAQAAVKGNETGSRPERWYGDIGAAQVADALRVIDPNYDPNKTPLPGLPSVPDGIGLAIGGAFVGLLVLGVAVFGNRNQ